MLFLFEIVEDADHGTPPHNVNNCYLCNKLRRWAAPQPLGDEGDACLRVCTTSSWNCQLKRLRVSESRAMLAFALLSVSRLARRASKNLR